jgi:tetratricopeptide (TPR) repeat protein
MRSAGFVAAFALSVGAGSAWAQASAECTIAQVEVEPLSVRAPCSRIIDDLSRSNEERGFALYVRGKGYHNTKSFDLARLDYDAAIALTPKNDAIYPSRANIALRAGRYDEGRRYLQKALLLNARNTDALRGYAALLMDAGDTEQALTYLNEVLELRPADAYALLWRSQLHRGNRKLAQALDDATRLVVMDPAAINRQGYLDGNGDRQDFHLIARKNRAKVHEAMARPDLAEEDYNAAVAYKPSARALFDRGVFLAYSRERKADGLVDLKRAAELEPQDKIIVNAVGRVHLALLQVPDALAAFDQVLKIDPTYSDALFWRARIHRHLDQSDKAFADMERAVLVDGSILDRLIHAMRRRGYWRSADMPTAMTPALQDAIHACMLDKQCN